MTDTLQSPIAVAEPTKPTRTKKALLLCARIVFTVAIVGAVAYACISQWPQVRGTFGTLTWPALAGALTAAVAGLLAQGMAFQRILIDLGYPVTARTANKIYLVGLTAKYLPGSVWSFVFQMELGRRAGIPRARALLASLVCLGLSTTAALVLSIPLLLKTSGTFALALLIVVPVALACSHPIVLTKLVNTFLRLTRAPQLDEKLSWRGVATTLGWSFIGWIGFGTQLWMLASSQSGLGVSEWLICVAAFALGLSAGTFGFLSPSGLGVREAVIATALLPIAPAGAGLALAMASRLVMTVADLVGAGLATVMSMGHRHQSPK
ncbi:MAG: UPF0104 family protein [Corynebacteriales bacterium]|nr:UPF0104 family protein [Mycobacteriales bacterium]